MQPAQVILKMHSGVVRLVERWTRLTDPLPAVILHFVCEPDVTIQEETGRAVLGRTDIRTQILEDMSFPTSSSPELHCTTKSEKAQDDCGASEKRNMGIDMKR
jgi:hypothetical protein